jgi:hypothetical protein
MIDINNFKDAFKNSSKLFGNGQLRDIPEFKIVRMIIAQENLRMIRSRHAAALSNSNWDGWEHSQCRSNLDCISENQMLARASIST